MRESFINSATNIQSVFVAGAGVMGIQMAMLFASNGCRVNVYDTNKNALSQLHNKVKSVDIASDNGCQSYKILNIDEVLCRITVFDKIEQAAEDVGMASEAIVEDFVEKRKLLKLLSDICSHKVIITTNTSMFIPSMFVKAIRYPERFVAFHFHSPIWIARIVDIMPHQSTNPDVVKTLVEFSRKMHMVPILTKKENHGYVYNYMLYAVIHQALVLRTEDIASIHVIDRAWMGVTGMPLGPFGMMDIVGIDTVLRIMENWILTANVRGLRNNVRFLKNEYVSKGLLGVKTGSGFYTYPAADYKRDDFIEKAGEERENG